MTRRTTRRLIAVVAVAVVIPLVGTFVLWWFVPTGTGEFRHSPDSRPPSEPPKVNTAGMKLNESRRNTTVPKAIRPPNTITGTMFMNSSTAKPAAVARAVKRTGRLMAAMVSRIAASLSPRSR